MDNLIDTPFEWVLFTMGMVSLILISGFVVFVTLRLMFWIFDRLCDAKDAKANRYRTKALSRWLASGRATDEGFDLYLEGYMDRHNEV